MRNELKKEHRVTEIYFNEKDGVIYGRTYNTKLKKQLLSLAKEYPDETKLIPDDEEGLIDFEINKNRLCFRINRPISDARRMKLSRLAKKNSEFYRGSAS